jgi:hypothetical protein
LDKVQDEALAATHAALTVTNSKIKTLEDALAAALALIADQNVALEVQNKLADENAALASTNQQNLDAALVRLGVANFANTPTVPPKGISPGCEGADEKDGGAPAFIREGDNLQIRACDGSVTISAAGCTVNPCSVQDDVEKLKLMVGLD